MSGDLIGATSSTATNWLVQNLKVAAVANRQTSGKAFSKGLSASNSVEEFLEQGLLPVPSSANGGLLQVGPLEPIGDVIEKIHHRRLRSCIVAFEDGKKEFFDCMDLACFILQAIEGPYGRAETDNWDLTKKKLRSVAEAPVCNAVKGGRGAGEFRRFDSDGSLFELLRMFSRLRRVPVYRHGELCRVVTPSDILEMCCCVSEDTKDCLEDTLLTEMMGLSPGILSEVQVSEDFSVLEVLQVMRDYEVNVTPVVEGFLGRTRSQDSVASFDCNQRSGSAATVSQQLMQANKQSQERVQDLIKEKCARTIVGQFETAAMRVMLVHLDADEKTWWWEDSSLSRNILLEPCMDYLSLSGTVVINHNISTPFNLMRAEETLARSITKVLTSNYQSVVVYPSTGPAGDSQESARGEPKFLSGTVSTLALVSAMLQGGLFEVLRFDAGKPRRDVSEAAGLGGKNRRARTSTLSKPKLPTPDSLHLLVESPGRFSKVKFCPTVEVDFLDVPTCPEHGIRYLKFLQDGELKYALDFRTLRDFPDASKVANAAAQCTSCSRPLGRVRIRPAPTPRSPPALTTSNSAGIFNLSLGDSNDWAFDLPFLRRSSPTLRQSDGSPVASALKAGTNFPLKKSKTAERLDAIRANHQAQTSEKEAADVLSKRGGFFGVCCSPCRMLSDKDQIQQSRDVGAGGSREDTGVSSNFDGVSSPLIRGSGRSSPLTIATNGSNGAQNGSEPTSPKLRVVREGTAPVRAVDVKDIPQIKRSVTEPTGNGRPRMRNTM